MRTTICIALLGALATAQDGASEAEPSPTRCAPGLVSWHANFETAVERARVSSKPVLHFQLLGRLDDAYC